MQILSHIESLVHALGQDLSSVPDPDIGDWFNNKAKVVPSELKQIII